MLDTLLRLLPVVLGMVAGFLLRRTGAADQRDGEFVFKLVFYVCLPALMFTSLSTVDVTGQLGIYPLAALISVATGYVAGRLVAARAHLDPTQRAVLLTGCMIVNSGFALPFVQALYGADGVARIAAFDAVNTTLTFSWVYYTAAKGNPHHEGGSLLLDRVIKSPPLYGVAAGLLVNLTDVRLPAALTGPVATFGSTTAVLISIGVGIMFEPLSRGLGKASLVVGTRLATGLLVAIALVLIFRLEGVDRTVVLLLGVAPVGFVSVTFASLEELDVRLAVNALSLSLLTSLVLSVGVTLLTAA